MKIIVDTCVWSLAVRRNEVQNNTYVNKLKELIKEIRVQLIGPVRQELLSGIKSKKQFREQILISLFAPYQQDTICLF